GRAIVVAEVALALVLLVGAGLLVRSFASLLDTDVGFATENRATIQTFLWDRNPTAAERIARAHAIVDALRTTPGVRAVGITTGAPFHPNRIDAESSLRIVGVTVERPGAEQRVTTLVASPDYFPAIGMTLASGRLFTEQDDAHAPLVALVNETAVRRYFGGIDPIGRKVSFGVMSAPEEREVIGVVRDTRPVRRDLEPVPEVFVPFAQSGSGSLTFVIETATDAAALLPTLQQRIWDVDPQQSVYYAATVEDLIGATLAERRFNLWLLASFSVLALVLAATGLYGLITFATERRMPELGVRLALGARPGDLTRMVVRDGVVLAAIGVAIGLVASWWLARLMTGMLYGVRATDPATYANIALLMLAVAALAAYIPARRAVNRDPLRTLREE
ncbi:MAG: FtsX-like permease family protein, partial [Longimicrobiales bacterium]